MRIVQVLRGSRDVMLHAVSSPFLYDDHLWLESLRNCSPAIADSAQQKKAWANVTLCWLPSCHLLVYAP